MRTCCVLVFLLSSVDSHLSVLMFPPRANYTRTADQNVTSPTITQHSAQHGATSSAQAAALGLINWLVAPKHGSLLSVPFKYVLDAFSLARAKRAASAARGAEPLYFEQKRDRTCWRFLVPGTAFCAAQLALHEAMRSPNASYSREPNALLVPSRSACCLCRRCSDLYHRDTSAPCTTCQVPSTTYLVYNDSSVFVHQLLLWPLRKY